MLARFLNSNLFFLAVEAIGLILGAALFAVLPVPVSLIRIQSTVKNLAAHRRGAILGTMVLALAGRLLLLPIFPIPVPGVHDEYSYLLSGATFAAGRLANPPSPLWQFFETFHTLQQPVYISMYPIAPGMFLAIGFLLGSPWIGVLLPVALFCGAVTWALQGLLPSQWALLGGMLAVLKFGLISYWVDSYWGGGVPALGGALVVGSAIRLLRRSRTRDAVGFSIGTLILANSRPFEGLALVSSIIGWIFYQVLKKRIRLDLRFATKLAPAAAVLLIGAVAMGYYFKKTTGDVFTMPYVRYAQEYSITKPFLWDNLLPEPVFHNVEMRRYYEREVPLYWRAHTLAGWATELSRKVSTFAMFYLWPGVLVTGISFRWIVRTEEGRFAVVMIVAVLAAISFEIWPMMLHYPSPSTTAAILLLVCAIRESRRLVPLGWQAGLTLAIPALCVGAVVVRAGAAAAKIPLPDHGLISYLTVAQGNVARQEMIDKLSHEPGNHLVIVRYRPEHDLSEEWVFNNASIDHSRIIWARELDIKRSDELIRHFPGRHVWLCQPDEKPPFLSSYQRTPAKSLSAPGSTR